jgi:prepilin-type N-terminal cleavage/methylation domain-containing protein
MKKGFTLIELLVVIGIITLITALVLPNYRAGDKTLALQRTVHKLSQDLRRAQGLAISAKDFAGESPDGYGLYFDLNQPTRYILFADLNDDKLYSGPGEKVEEIFMESKMEIVELSPSDGSTLTVFFAPPDPSVFFTPDSSLLATITVAIVGVEFLTSDYKYEYQDIVWFWPDPRAGCDITNDGEDCPASFSAMESDPQTVYDWYKFSGIFDQAKRYEKQEGGEPLRVDNSVHVNKAGLIYVD